MRTINTLYKYSKEHNTPLLINSNSLVYPTIEGSTVNFLTDYETNKAELDRMFWLRYSSMKTILPEDDITLDEFFLNWKDSVKSVFYFYLEGWARLYYALDIAYNPIWNYDGENTRTTKGKVEGLSGSDTITDTIAQKQKDLVYAQDTTTSTSSEVPFDSIVEKEVGKNVDIRGSRTDSITDHNYVDTHATAFGKKNEVDYTETEIKHGNQGTTTTQQMLREEFELRKQAFWDNVFRAICKELLYR